MRVTRGTEPGLGLSALQGVGQAQAGCLGLWAQVLRRRATVFRGFEDSREPVPVKPDTGIRGRPCKWSLEPTGQQTGVEGAVGTLRVRRRQSSPWRGGRCCHPQEARISTAMHPPAPAPTFRRAAAPVAEAHSGEESEAWLLMGGVQWHGVGHCGELSDFF